MQNALITTMNAWAAILGKAAPAAFPPLTFLSWPPRQFPESLEEDVERHILRLVATEKVLVHPDLYRNWWDPCGAGSGFHTGPWRPR
jgi:hypothetical protein